MSKVFHALNNTRVQNTIAISVFIVMLMIIAFGTASFNDFWWHLAIGKWMFATRSLLKHEIFALAFQGKEWLNNTWLFDGTIYLIHKTTGFWGLNALRLLVFTGTYWFLYKASSVKHKAPVIFSVTILMFTVPMIRNLFRPEILSPLFISIFLFTLYTFKYHKSKLIYLLPLVELLWVNTHGGFPVGIILICIFFGSELWRSLIQYRNNVLDSIRTNPRIKTYFGILVASILATLANPYGYKIFMFVGNMLADKETLSTVSEWKPLSWTVFLSVNLSSRLAFVVIGWVVALTLFFSLKKLWKHYHKAIPVLQHFNYEDLLIVIFFLLSAITYVRGMHIFTVVAAMLFLRNLHYWPRLKIKIRDGSIVGLIVLAVVLSLSVYYYREVTINTGPTVLQQPKESIAFIKDNNIAGNYINEYARGGDLIWLLYPEYKVFMDGRSANVYDTSYYWYYRSLHEENIFLDAIDKYDINFAIIPHGWDVISGADQSENWVLIFFDNHSSVYVRNNDVNKDIIDKYKYTFLTPALNQEVISAICQKPEQLETLQNEINRNLRELDLPLASIRSVVTIADECDVNDDYRDKAVKLMHLAITAQPNNAEHYHNVATVQLKLGHDQSALKNYKKSFDISASKQNMTGYGIALHNLENYLAAEKAFVKALSLPGDFPDEYYQIYGRTLYQLDKNDKAIDMLHRYQDLLDEDQITARDYADLSFAYKDDQQDDKAVEYLSKAYELDPEFKVE